MAEAGQDDPVTSREEYFRQLRQWLHETQHWNNMQMQYYVANYTQQTTYVRQRAPRRPFLSTPEAPHPAAQIPQPATQIPQQRLPRVSEHAETQGLILVPVNFASVWNFYS